MNNLEEKKRIIIAINGTPGSGKTTIANLLANKNTQVINIGEFSVQSNCVEFFDEGTQSNVIQEDCLAEQFTFFVEQEIQKGTPHIIVEGHLVDIIPEKYIRHCFVLQVTQDDLRERLQSRGYSEKKILANIQAENMKDCFIVSLNSFGQEKVTLVPIANIPDTIRFIKHKNII